MDNEMVARIRSITPKSFYGFQEPYFEELESAKKLAKLHKLAMRRKQSDENSIRR